MRFDLRVSAFVALSAVLSACGGGGGDSPPPQATLSGQVMPSGSGLTGQSVIGQPQLAGPGRIAPVEPQPCRCGEAVVWFADGLSPEASVRALADATGEILQIETLVTADGPVLISGGPARVDETVAWIDTLKDLPSVSMAEPNYMGLAAQEPPVPQAPNDPVTAQHSWSFDMIRTGRAWSVTRGDASVVVAVVDSGVGLSGLPHPDLQGQLLPGFDFVDGDTDAADVPGQFPHGTHVAGTVAAVTNNSIGVAGVAPGVRLLPVRVCGPDGCPAVAVAQGIRWAAGLPVPGVPNNPNPARVINLSLGFGLPPQVVQDAVQASVAAGAVVVAASGNDSRGPIRFPAAFPEAIAVSALTPIADLALYSNVGPENEIAAPGGRGSGRDAQVWSTAYRSERFGIQADYCPSPGTSMACPHVAAVAALMLSANPTLTVQQVRTALQETAIDLGPSGRDDEFGFGLVDAGVAVVRAVELAGGSPSSVDPRLTARTPLVRLTSSEPGTTVRLTNSGDGAIQITSVSAFSLEDGARVPDPAWLSAVIENGSVSDTQDGTLAVTAEPSLAGGSSRQGLLVVDSDAGPLTIPILFAADAVPDVGTVVVKAIDALTGEVTAQTTTNLAANYIYEIDGLPPGTYFLEALVDVDADGEALRPDEWDGDFPITDRQSVVVQEGQTRMGLNIPIQQAAESIRPGTGGGVPQGALAVLVRSSETKLPIEGARVILGDGDSELLTDARGIAVFTGVTGSQTITAVATGFNPETFLSVGASRIGFSLDPTRLPEETGTDVDVQVQDLLNGEVAFVFVGFGAGTASTVEGGDPANPNATTVVRVAGPAVISVMVVDPDVGETVALGYGVIDAALLETADPMLQIPVVDFPASAALNVDTTGSASALDTFLMIPVVLGADSGEAAVLGLAAASSAGVLSTPVFTGGGLGDLPATVLTLSSDSTSGGFTLGLKSSTVGALPGTSFDSPLPAPPVPTSPIDGGMLSEGGTATFTAGASGSFGSFALSRPSDGWEWTIYFGEGVTNVGIPVVGLLTPGDYDAEITIFGTSVASYETLEDLPSEFREGIAALDFFLVSEDFALSVP